MKRKHGQLSAMQQKGGLLARESDMRKQRLQAELRVKRYDNDLIKLGQDLVNYCANPSTKPKDTRKKRDVLRGAARPWAELQKDPDHLHIDPTENLWEKHMGQFCQHDLTANYVCLLLDAAECCMSHRLHKRALGYLERALILDSGDMFGAQVLQVICQICLGTAKNVGALLSDENHVPPAQLRGGRAFTYKSRTFRRWVIAIWKYLQWRQAIKGKSKTVSESGKKRRKRKLMPKKPPNISPANSVNSTENTQAPAALEEDVLEAVKNAHLENPYMVAQLCYVDIFNEIIEYLEEIDAVTKGSVEEALLLSTTLQNLILEHSSIDGAGFITWLTTFTTDLPLAPHPLLEGVNTANLCYQNDMYKGMFVSACEAVRENIKDTE